MKTFQKISSIPPACKVALCMLSTYWMLLSSKTSTRYKAKHQGKIEDCSRIISGKLFSAFQFALFRQILFKGSLCLLEIYHLFIYLFIFPWLSIYFLWKKEEKKPKDYGCRIHPFHSQWGLTADCFLWGALKTVISLTAVVAVMNCSQLMLGVCSLWFMKNTEYNPSILRNATWKEFNDTFLLQYSDRKDSSKITEERWMAGEYQDFTR